MKNIKSVILMLVILLLLLLFLNEIDIEGYGRGYRYRKGKRRSWDPRLGHRYRHRRRSLPQQRYIWYYPRYWFFGSCKNGCINLGKGRWGCQYPGEGESMCRFAEDCYGCGY